MTVGDVIIPEKRTWTVGDVIIPDKRPSSIEASSTSSRKAADGAVDGLVDELTRVSPFKKRPSSAVTVAHATFWGAASEQRAVVSAHAVARGDVACASRSSFLEDSSSSSGDERVKSPARKKLTSKGPPTEGSGEMDIHVLHQPIMSRKQRSSSRSSCARSTRSSRISVLTKDFPHFPRLKSLMLIKR